MVFLQVTAKNVHFSEQEMKVFLRLCWCTGAVNSDKSVLFSCTWIPTIQFKQCSRILHVSTRKHLYKRHSMQASKQASKQAVHCTYLTGSSHQSIAATPKQPSSIYLAPENLGLGESSLTKTTSATIPKTIAVMYAPTHSSDAESTDLIGYVYSDAMSSAIGIARNAMTLMHMRHA